MNPPKTIFKIEEIKVENRQDREWGWGFLVSEMRQWSPEKPKPVLTEARRIVKESKIYGLSCECSTFIYNKKDRTCKHTEAVMAYLQKDNLINSERFSVLKEKILLREL